MTDKIKVLIADDMPSLLRRYVSVLSKDEQLRIIAAVETGEEAVKIAQTQRPDVVLLDIEMETRTAGLDTAKKLLEIYPDIKIVILTVYEDDETVFAAFQTGVSDYVLKNSTPRQLIDSVKDAYYNRSPIRPVIAEKIRKEFARVKTSEISFMYCLTIIAKLTQTELDILGLLEKGYSRQQICELRTVELSTVKTQIHNILLKFEKPSMAQLLEMLRSLKIFEYIYKLPGGMK